MSPWNGIIYKLSIEWTELASTDTSTIPVAKSDSFSAFDTFLFCKNSSKHFGNCTPVHFRCCHCHIEPVWRCVHDVLTPKIMFNRKESNPNGLIDEAQKIFPGLVTTVLWFFSRFECNKFLFLCKIKEYEKSLYHMAVYKTQGPCSLYGSEGGRNDREKYMCLNIKY